jgi:vacuolar-type H+-ATPase subunit H
MGLFDFFTAAVGSAIDISEAREVVNEALQEALATMEGMCANEGQLSVFGSYVAPAFEDAKGSVDNGWTDVDIGEYMDFMGEIVEEGNSIMSDAYDEAQEILSELEEEIEGEFDEETGEMLDF